MHVIYPDVQMTRRNRLFWIMDEHDKPLASFGTLIQALDWLLERGETCARIEGREAAWVVILDSAWQDLHETATRAAAGG